MTADDLSQKTLDAIDIPVFVIDKELRIAKVNQAICQMFDDFKLDRKALVGRRLSEVLPFLTEETEERTRDVFSDGKATFFEWASVVGGRKLVLEICRFPLRSGRHVTHVVLTLRDIARQRELEESLRESENLARALMDASTESMFLLAHDGSIALANEVGARRLGRTTENIKGATGDQVFAPKVWKNREPYVRRVLATGEPARLVDVRDGRTIDMSMVPILGPDGTTSQIAIFAQDITDRERSLAALKDSEDRFRGLFRHIPVPTYVWKQAGDDFILDDVNDAADKTAEGKLNTLVGKKASEIFAGRPDILDNLRTCAAEKMILRRDLSYVYTLTQKERYLQASLVFIPPDSVLMHTVDITEQRRAQKSLQETSSALEAEVERRTEELAELNEQLNVEREALRQKNIALQEVIEQAGRTKDSVALQIQSNVQRIVLPVLDRLDARIDEANRQYLTLARSSLLDIVSPFLHTLESQYRQLTPSEIEICELIQKGYSSKEISRHRNTSVQTIIKQRKTIRRKLRIDGTEANLKTFLNSVSVNEHRK